MKIYRSYILICPIENIVRYVGITYQTLEKRLNKHIRDKRNPRKYYWMKKLKKQNLKPEIKLVCGNLTEAQVCKSEKELIALYRYLVGKRLLNIADGGDLPPSWKGKKHTEETKKK